ncbi:hypothetical protein AMTRI_Chr01g133730 [Amborella trichopoda]
MGINCRGPALQSLALVVGCKLETFLITCLGLPISDSKFPITVWDKTIERVQVKLDLWKYKYLSLGGRVTLLRSSLANLPVYQMSIEILMRDFLWGTHGENNKYHLLRRDRVCTPKREGGLGIQRLRYFNATLLCKWWWRSSHFRSHLWCQVLIAKYGLESYNVWISSGRGRESSYMWRAIYNCRPMISGYFRWNIGSGRQILFWHHKWLGDYPLKVAFRDMFQLTSNQNILVCNIVERRGNQITWSIPLIYRRISDGIQSQWCAMMELLEQVYVAQDAEDIFVWEVENDGIFSIKSWYNLFFHDIWRWSSPLIVQIWKWPIPHKVHIVVWLAS